MAVKIEVVTFHHTSLLSGSHTDGVPDSFPGIGFVFPLEKGVICTDTFISHPRPPLRSTAGLSGIAGHVKKSDQQSQSKWILISSPENPTDDLDS